MNQHWTKRQIDQGNWLVCNASGDMIAITDARYVDLILAAPALLSACLAALAYDAGIQRHADKATPEQPFVQSDDLDRLYEDWLDAARAAVARTIGGQP